MCRAEPDMKERGQSGVGDTGAAGTEVGGRMTTRGRASRLIVGPGERMDELAEKVRLTSQRQSERAWGVWPGLVGSVPGQTALELPCPGPVSGPGHVCLSTQPRSNHVGSAFEKRCE